MHCVSLHGAVNTQGFVWKFFYALYVHFHSFIHSFINIIIILRNCVDFRARVV